MTFAVSLQYFAVRALLFFVLIVTVSTSTALGDNSWVRHRIAAGFACRLSADASSFEVLTYLAGSGKETATFILAHSDGSFVIGGRTDSSKFPFTGALFGESTSEPADFLVRLTESGAGPVYALPLPDFRLADAEFDSAGKLYLFTIVFLRDYGTSVEQASTPGVAQLLPAGEIEGLLMKVSPDVAALRVHPPPLDTITFRTGETQLRLYVSTAGQTSAHFTIRAEDDWNALPSGGFAPPAAFGRPLELTVRATSPSSEPRSV